jgi:hypothetical protein
MQIEIEVGKPPIEKVDNDGSDQEKSTNEKRDREEQVFLPRKYMRKLVCEPTMRYLQLRT